MHIVDTKTHVKFMKGRSNFGENEAQENLRSNARKWVEWRLVL